MSGGSRALSTPAKIQSTSAFDTGDTATRLVITTTAVKVGTAGRVLPPTESLALYVFLHSPPFSIAQGKLQKMY